MTYGTRSTIHGLTLLFFDTSLDRIATLSNRLDNDIARDQEGLLFWVSCASCVPCVTILFRRLPTVRLVVTVTSESDCAVFGVPGREDTGVADPEATLFFLD